MTKKTENFSDRVVEIEDSDPDVAPSKGGKMFVLVLSAVIIAFILYSCILTREKEVVSEEIVIEERGRATVVEEAPEQEVAIPDIGGEEFGEEFFVPEIPELPELPELSEDIAQSIAKAEEERRRQEEEFAKRLEEERIKQEEAEKALEEKIAELERMLSQAITEEERPVIQPRAITPITPTVTRLPGEPEVSRVEEEVSIAKKRALSQRKATNMLTKSSSIGPKSSFVDGGGIVLSNENTVRALEESTVEVTAQRVKDLSTTILEGKLIYAVLETAINTDFEGTLRGIVNRDVFAEQGKNVLISKGSRLIGTYSSNVTRGQARLMITWNRIIRTDGVEIAINSQTTDQFGRSGLQGDVDNKYVEILGNSLLTSILSIATAIATEEVTDSTGITSTISSDTGSTTQTSGKASDYAIIDATQKFMESAEDLVQDLSKSAKPTMRIPQGTKLIVFVNQDLSIPPIEK